MAVGSSSKLLDAPTRARLPKHLMLSTSSYACYAFSHTIALLLFQYECSAFNPNHAGMGTVCSVVDWAWGTLINWTWHRNAFWLAFPVPTHAQGESQEELKKKVTAGAPKPEQKLSNPTAATVAARQQSVPECSKTADQGLVAAHRSCATPIGLTGAYCKICDALAHLVCQKLQRRG